jgi:hypothetical protein
MLLHSDAVDAGRPCSLVTTTALRKKQILKGHLFRNVRPVRPLSMHGPPTNLRTIELPQKSRAFSLQDNTERARGPCMEARPTSRPRPTLDEADHPRNCGAERVTSGATAWVTMTVSPRESVDLDHRAADQSLSHAPARDAGAS